MGALQFNLQQAQDLASDADLVADRVPVLFAAVGIFVGAGVGAAVIFPWAGVAVKIYILSCVLGMISGAAVGFGLGQVYALQLRIQAMVNLAQVQLERNTRKEKPAAAEPTGPPSASSVRRDPPQMQKTVLSRPPAQRAAP